MLVDSFLDRYLEHDREFLYYIISRPKVNRKVLYIGQSTFSIRNRIQSHRRNWLYDHFGDHKVSLGFFERPWRVGRDIIDDAEKALIFYKKPPENRREKYSITLNRNYIIYNTGYRGLLPQELDTRDLE